MLEDTKLVAVGTGRASGTPVNKDAVARLAARNASRAGKEFLPRKNISDGLEKRTDYLLVNLRGSETSPPPAS